MSITHGWISRSSMITLGNLPALESPELYVDDLGCHMYARQLNEECSPASFPALRHLSLRHTPPYDHNDIFEFRRLFERITELEVHLLDEDCDDIWIADEEEPVEWSIVPSLSTAPRLGSLLITHSSKETPNTPLGDQGSLDAMARLPLQKIDIAGLSLGKAPFAVDLGVIWSTVNELVLPRQTASLRELAYFAAMPLLMRLVVALDLTTAFTPANIPATNYARLTTL